MKLEAWTVKKLIAELQKQDANKLVVLEGCDCADDCAGIKILSKRNLLLRRLDMLTDEAERRSKNCE